MFTVLSRDELINKGVTKKMVAGMLRRCESRVSWFAAQCAQNGFECSAKHQKEWDLECVRWDHLKATLRALE